MRTGVARGTAPAELEEARDFSAARVMYCGAAGGTAVPRAVIAFVVAPVEGAAIVFAFAAAG